LLNELSKKQQPTRLKAPLKKRDRTKPFFTSENIDKYITVDGINDPNAFALVVKGKSMEPRIHDGDIIVISPSANVKSGDTCVVRVGDEDTVKVVKFDHNIIHLIPLNPGYEPMTVQKSQTSFIWKVVKLIANI
jgi:SOS-response transcriptional repressor LexA